MDLSQLHIETKPQSAYEILKELFPEDHDQMLVCCLIKSQIPMYQGNLNPKWKYWDDVAQLIKPGSTEDQQREYVKVLINETTVS